MFCIGGLVAQHFYDCITVKIAIAEVLGISLVVWAVWY